MIEDFDYFTQFLWQYILLDSPFPYFTDKPTLSDWTKILKLKCRQRIMYLPSLFIKTKDENTYTPIDFKLIIHFLASSLFNSLDKIYSWSLPGTLIKLFIDS